MAVIGTSLDAGRRIVARCEKAQIPDVWFPVFRETFAEGGRVRTRTSPLWPGYAFILLRLSEISRGRAIRGVHEFLKTESGISSLSRADVELLRGRERDGVVCLPRQRFAVGERVKEIGSSFAFGLWQGMNIDGRHRVLYSLLGRPVEALVEDLSLRRYD